MAASPGLEPRLTESESAVLPLDDEAKVIVRLYMIKKAACQIFYQSVINIFLSVKDKMYIYTLRSRKIIN